MATVRVSFQGGGAYLALMLPIAHAISDTQRHNLIHVEGVSGASAGAICAALLASGCDFVKLRQELKRQVGRDERLRKDAKRLAGAYYKSIGPAQIAWTVLKVLSGTDLIARKKLEDFLLGLFAFSKVANGDPKAVDLEEFNNDPDCPNLFIARSKLSADFLEISDKGNLFDAIIDSCSIPFAFKSYRSARKHDYVDGGMCENLPVKCFGLEDDIPIFAVSVSADEKESHDSMGLLGYLRRLFSMTIGYSVVRSREFVGDSYCLEEEADFKFHEVSKAVDWYLDDDKYEKVLRKYRARFQGFADYYRLSAAGSVFMVGKSTVTKRDSDMRDVFRMLLREIDWNIINSTMIVTAHSANPQIEQIKTDVIQFVGKVVAGEDAPRAYKGHILLAGQELHPTSWSVRNVTRQTSLPFRAVHYQDSTDGGVDVDPCYLVFEDPETHIGKGDILEIRAVMPTLPGASMADLNAKGSDYIVMNNKHKSAAVSHIVLRYPSILGDLVPSPRGGGVEFTKMSAEELREFEPDVDREFRAVGVKSCRPVEQNEMMAVDFTKAKPYTE